MMYDLGFEMIIIFFIRFDGRDSREISEDDRDW